MAASSNQPTPTLYLNNLPPSIHKSELRLQLYSLFSTYGKLLDVVALKSPKMRGQAFVVFADLGGATGAMRALEGMVFYDKPMHIDYAKSKSYATKKKEDPSFVPPNALSASLLSTKRARDEDTSTNTASKHAKKDKQEGSDEEMDLDDEDEGEDVPTVHSITPETVPPTVEGPTSRLLCTNLPQEVTDSVLSVLLQSHDGYKSVRTVPSPSPNAQGEALKMAEVLFSSREHGRKAREAMDGFKLKKGWAMVVAFI